METDKDEVEVIIGPSSNPNLENDIDPDENLKMRGDAIGNTMYSERFVLTTLLQLLENEWNEELESDLCSIWDMTTEKDVVMFLLEKNFVALASEIIARTKEFRLIEILVGVLGNMCVLLEVCEHFFAVKESRIFFSLINSTDTPTLVQLMRLLKCLLYSNINYNEVINVDVLDRIHFILRSSQNSELLLNTLILASDIISKKFLKTTELKDFLNSANEAFKELSVEDDEDLNLSRGLTRTIEKNITAYLKVLENIRTIMTEYDPEKYDTSLPAFDDDSVKQTVQNIQDILNYCTDEEVSNMRDTVEYFIGCSALALITIQASFHYKVFKRFIHIYNCIITNDTSSASELLPLIIEIVIYMVNCADIELLQKSLKRYSVSKMKSLFIDNIIEKQKCDDLFVTKINTLIFQ